MAAVMKTATASGNIASFWSPKATNIKSFKIYFNPIQDGRGTPDPENIRPINGQYGINYWKFQENMLIPTPGSQERYGVEMVTNPDGTVEFEGSPTSYSGIKAGNVYFKEGQTQLVGKIIGDNQLVSFNGAQLYDKDNNHVATIATGWEVSTRDNNYAFIDLTNYPTATRAIINLKRTNNTQYMNEKCHPVVIDSIDKIPQKMSKIPFHLSNQNLYEITANPSYGYGLHWYVRNESVKIYGTPTNVDGLILGHMDLPEEKGNIVISSTMNECTNITWDWCTLTDVSGSVVYSFKNTTASFVINLDDYPSAKRLMLKIRPISANVETSGLFRVMVEKGNTPSGEYEPYNTPLYGGYVDLVTGEIWKTHHHYVFTGDETFYTSGSNCVTSFIPLVNGEKMRAYGPSWSGVCTHYPYGPYKQGSIGVMYGENTCTFDSRIRDAEGWKAFAKEQYDAGTPIEVAYLLRDPVLVGTLTPQQLSSLVGRNYYYSNADKVEVEYEYADSPELEVIKKRIALNEPHIGTVEGTVGHFYTDMAAPVQSLKVSFSPRQPGTGDASPTNVRPILGFDNISVKRCGINLLQCDTFSDRNARGIKYEGIRNAENEIESIHVYGTAEQNNCFTNLNATANKIKLVSGSFGFYGYAEDGVNIYPITDKYGFAARDGKSISSGDSSWHIIDIPSYKLDNSNQAWVRIQAIPDSTTSYVGTSIDTTVYPMMCVEEDVGCDFEPYHGDTYTVSFSELGTQYGGYVDLVKGELTATHYHLDINTTSIPSMKIDGIYNNYIVIQFGVTGNNLPQFVENTQISNRFSKSLPSGTPGRITTTSKYIYMIIPKDNLTGSDIAAIREWFANNPTEVVYELKTPVTYQLTSQQIKTFRGTNNIYSFDGTVDVKYWLHSDVKTERKTAQI